MPQLIGMSTIKSHEEVVAWQLSEDLKDRVFEILARPAALKNLDFCDNSCPPNGPSPHSDH